MNLENKLQTLKKLLKIDRKQILSSKTLHRISFQEAVRKSSSKADDHKRLEHCLKESELLGRDVAQHARKFSFEAFSCCRLLIDFELQLVCFQKLDFLLGVPEFGNICQELGFTNLISAIHLGSQ